MAVRIPAALQARAMPGTSCTSKVREPGDSISTSRVAVVASAMTSSALAEPGKYRVEIPKCFRASSQNLRVGA
jgi:hypothetical protein